MATFSRICSETGADPASKVHRTNVPKTCGACHGQKFVMEASGHSAQPFINYQESVHGKSIAKNAEAITANGTGSVIDTNGDGTPDITPAIGAIVNISGTNTIAAFNTYVLESESVTGPWKMVEYMKSFGEQAYFVNIPSKFVGDDAPLKRYLMCITDGTNTIPLATQRICTGYCW